tara:strand:- start:2680 stop:3789 length:1110 start_codon:yes stop_codon:yes gene_type:complete
MTQVNVALVVDEIFKADRVFDVSASRDNIFERFFLLRKHLYNFGMTCRTVDMFEPSKIDILIFHDLMNSLDVILKIIKSNPFVKLVYVPNEPYFIIPLHDSKILPQLPVDCILTWNDQIASKFYHVVKCNIGQPVIFKKDIPSIPFKSKKFISSICSYKSSNVEVALYEERVYAIDFFSKQPTNLDLYGIGWDKADFSFIKPSYKGPCENKRDVLQKYKFSIAYENIATLPGLITEKIFDCFSAGTIPVYIGAPNIKDYIPPSCFIDVRDFRNYEQLYEYLVSMPESEYQQYLDATITFINTPEYDIFTSRFYAKTVVEQICILSKKNKVRKTLFSLKWKLIQLLLLNPRVLKFFRSYKLMAKAILTVW